MARLSYKEREGMSKKEFAIPKEKTAKNPAGKGGYPIPDESHARNALARVSQFGDADEKAAVRAKVKAKYPEIGQKTAPKPAMKSPAKGMMKKK